MTFIDEHRDRFVVALLLRVLNIAESTYYQWVKQAEQPCDRDVVDLGLISHIHDIWQASGRTYGSDRVHRQLRRDGIRVGRKRVERLMAEQGWHGAFLRRGWRGGSTRQDPRHTPALLRQYFPKGTDLSRWDLDDLLAVQTGINNRPRKVLDWRTPAEALDEQLRLLQPTGVATTG